MFFNLLIDPFVIFLVSAILFIGRATYVLVVGAGTSPTSLSTRRSASNLDLISFHINFDRLMIFINVFFVVELLVIALNIFFYWHILVQLLRIITVV